ncbi:hypothetical protein [Streptomyces sp. CC228A]|uniref:hypothetical protein n=1 Tax=Streptomyces sp. CC228A TaxID=2898186 RepID=UPI001F2F82DD|nr:hypothetical protein [Streptomyces sp. CC228A]
MTGTPPTAPRDVLVRNLWASPAVFVTAAFTAFNAVGTDLAVRVGWACYAAGWLPPILAVAVCAARKQRPGMGGAAAAAVLAVFGALFWLNHS